MNKEFYKSKTFWGVLLLTLETFMRGVSATLPYNLDPVVLAVGVLLTGYGFRSAMK